MINAVSYNSNVSFRGLPNSLQRLPIASTNAKGICDIIKDAGLKANIVIKTTATKVVKNNPNLFNADKQVTKEGAELLKEEYKATTCRELRDALAKAYKKYGKSDGILDIII